MPSSHEPIKERTLQDVVEETGLYPVEAFDFVQRGLSYTVSSLHGSESGKGEQLHVNGQQLCEGLREFAIAQWGYLAGTVLRRWNLASTMDFGRIVFALVEGGLMQATEEDSIEDFRNIYDFKTAFEANYKIESKS